MLLQFNSGQAATALMVLLLYSLPLTSHPLQLNSRPRHLPSNRKCNNLEWHSNGSHIMDLIPSSHIHKALNILLNSIHNNTL